MERNEYAQDSVTFRAAEYPRSLDDSRISKRRCRRRGTGRKRVYEAGYQIVHDMLQKTVSIHTSVFGEWIRE